MLVRTNTQRQGTSKSAPELSQSVEAHRWHLTAFDSRHRALADSREPSDVPLADAGYPASSAYVSSEAHELGIGCQIPATRGWVSLVAGKFDRQMVRGGVAAPRLLGHKLEFQVGRHARHIPAVLLGWIVDISLLLDQIARSITPVVHTAIQR